MRDDLSGILSALMTPMNAGGTEIDEKTFARLVRSQVVLGVHGLVVAGTTGEHSTLSLTERKRLCEIAVAEVGGRMPVIVQVGAPGSQQSFDLARHAVASGADHLMVVPPYYDRLRWADLVHYLGECASIAGKPVIYYHTPRVTGLDLTEDELVSLARAGHISHIKDSAANFTATMRLLLNPEAPKVFAGSDPAMMAALACGAMGSILGASTFIPEICVALYDAIVLEKNLAAAQGIWKRLWPILNFLLLNGYVATTKAGARLRGMPAGDPRAPLLPADETSVAALSQLLRTMDIGQLPPVA
jgi:dihydrodipicolinate synthase/N-acetylneuraminate lyase